MTVRVVLSRANALVHVPVFASADPTAVGFGACMCTRHRRSNALPPFRIGAPSRRALPELFA